MKVIIFKDQEGQEVLEEIKKNKPYQDEKLISIVRVVKEVKESTEEENQIIRYLAKIEKNAYRTDGIVRCEKVYDGPQGIYYIKILFKTPDQKRIFESVVNRPITS